MLVFTYLRSPVIDTPPIIYWLLLHWLKRGDRIVQGKNESEAGGEDELARASSESKKAQNPEVKGFLSHLTCSFLSLTHIHTHRFQLIAPIALLHHHSQSSNKHKEV
jgi:flavin reductase (DIM6/NTAB) family NADH-FMN oxidoreductase RutF